MMDVNVVLTYAVACEATDSKECEARDSEDAVSLRADGVNAEVVLGKGIL